MKVQKFYPKQVMRRLKGRSVETLNNGEKAALSFFMRKGRKFGMAIGVQNDAKYEDLIASNSKAAANVILASSNSKIFLKLA